MKKIIYLLVLLVVFLCTRYADARIFTPSEACHFYSNQNIEITINTENDCTVKFAVQHALGEQTAEYRNIRHYYSGNKRCMQTSGYGLSSPVTQCEIISSTDITQQKTNFVYTSLLAGFTILITLLFTLRKRRFVEKKLALEPAPTKERIFLNTILWGFGLWLFGYILSFVFFFIIPSSLIGWVIMPFGIVFTLWVLLKKIKSGSLKYYLLLACIWTLIAIVLDYLFIVKAFKPADGYYKLDVYIYYTLIFILPLIVGFRKKHKISLS